MDEPYGALDPITREALQELIKNLQEKLGKTVVFVTHDMDEALKLSQLKSWSWIMGILFKTRHRQNS